MATFTNFHTSFLSGALAKNIENSSVLTMAKCDGISLRNTISLQSLVFFFFKDTTAFKFQAKVKTKYFSFLIEKKPEGS